MHCKPPGIYPLGQVLYSNPPIEEVPCPSFPRVSPEAVVGVNSMIIGDVVVCPDVYIGFHNIIRADSSAPYYIGSYSNIQDFVMIHCHPGEALSVHGSPYGVFIEGRVSILHHAAVHGPVFIGDNTFVGQHCSLFGAKIGRSCVLSVGSIITGEVRIADNRYVAPGQTVATQEQADALPEVPEKLRRKNESVVDHYYRLGKSYRHHTPLML